MAAPLAACAAALRRHSSSSSPFGVAAAAAAAAMGGTLQLTRRAASSLSNVIQAESGKTKLQAYTPLAFVVNGVQVEGPILCLPDSWLLWDVSTWSDVTPDSLALLDLVDPPPEVLVVGCGVSMRPLPDPLVAHLRARGIAAEVLDTRNALSYFNFLNDEGRSVVGALLPAGATSQ